MTDVPAQQAAAWLAGRLLRPVVTTAEAQLLTGRPPVGDDTTPAVSAVDAGLVTIAQVDAYRREWHRALADRGLPLSAIDVIRAQDLAGPAVSALTNALTRIEPDWRIEVDVSEVTVWLQQHDGAPPQKPVRVWPAAADTDRLLEHTLAIHEWWPCLRWADTLTSAARTLGRATEPELTALPDIDQQAVIALVGAGIRRAVRQIRLTRDPQTRAPLPTSAVMTGMVEMDPIRERLSPHAVATTLGPGPPTELGGPAWAHLLTTDPARQGRLADLARAVVDDWIDRAAQEHAHMRAGRHFGSVNILFLASPPAWATQRPRHGVFLTPHPDP